MIRWLTIFLDFPARDFAAGVAFWRAVTGSALSPYRGPDRAFATLLPAGGDPYLRVQRVRAGAGGCHLDLHLDGGAAALAETAARAAGLGASEVHRDDGLVILDSPGRFRFCLVRWEGQAAAPEPVYLDSAGTGPSGAAAGLDGAGASRADQLCLDIPPGVFDRECSFWAALTGWDLRAGALPEFAHLERPPGIPGRLLLQRRAEAGSADDVTGHVDFACTARERLAERHAAWGARSTGTFPHWLAMTDPGGRPYCLTRRDPMTGKLPQASNA